MDISLNLKSPRVTLEGVDLAIRRMEELEAVHGRLQKLAGLSFKVNVTGLDGLDKLNGAVVSMQRLAEVAKEVGATDVGEKLAGGLITAGEAAKMTALKVAQMKRDIQESRLQLQQEQGKYQAMFENASGAYSPTQRDKLGGAKQALIRSENAVQELENQAAAMTRLLGMLEASTGAEHAKGAATQQATTATQEEVVASQQASVALKQEAASAKQTEQALRGLLSVRKDFEGEKLTGQTKVFRTGAGRTETISGLTGKRRSEETNFEQQQLLKLERVREEFAARRSMAIQGGAQRGGPEVINILRDEVEARSRILSQLSASDLIEGRMGRMEATKVQALAEQVSLQAQALKKREEAADMGLYEESRRRARSSIDTGFRVSKGELEKEMAVEKAGNLTHRETVDLLNRQAAAYERLGEAARASGRGATPMGITFERRAGQMRAEAATMEAEMQRTQQQISARATAAQAEFDAFGGKLKGGKEEAGPGGRTLTSTVTKDNANAMRETVTLTRRWNQAGEELEPTLTRVNRALEGTGRSATSAGKSMLDNIVTVTAWAAAVGVLYKSLELVSFAISSVFKVDQQTQRLMAVFRGSNEEGEALRKTVVALRDNVLELAVANGRSGDEAMDAAIRWSRLGLTQKQVAEAVDVSLKAANVAELDAATAAEQLSAIYAAYGLQVGELRTKLNELNAISNVYNATSKDMLNGIARSSAIAKQAGMSFEELAGIIASGVGRTGRSGAELGNAVKAMIVSFSNPQIQKMLKTDFEFKVHTPKGELKDISTMLNEIYLLYQKLTKGEKGEFLQKIAGKQQASRFQAIIDGYVQSQVLAIKAQQDMGEAMSSADRENALIRSSLTSQLEAMSVAFQRLAVNIAGAGSQFRLLDEKGTILLDPSIMGTLTALVELMTHLVNSAANLAPYVEVLGIVMLAMGIRIAKAAMSMGEAGAKGNILTRTLAHLGEIWTTVGLAIQKANGDLAANTALLNANGAAAGRNAAAQGAGAATGVGAGAVGAKAKRGLASGVGKLLIGTIFSEEFAAFILITAAIEGIMAIVNKLFRDHGDATDEAGKKLGIYNRELERTKALVGAADLSQRLASTLGKGLGTLAPGAGRKAIDDYASIAFNREEDPKGQRATALRDELAGLYEKGQISKAQEKLDAMAAYHAERKRYYARQELGTRREVLAAQQDEIKALEGVRASRISAHLGTTEQDKALQVARKRAEDLAGDAKKTYSEAYDTNEAESPTQAMIRTRLAARIEGQKSAMEALPQVSEKEEDHAKRRLAVTEALIASLDREKTASRANRDAIIADAEAKATQAGMNPENAREKKLLEGRLFQSEREFNQMQNVGGKSFSGEKGVVVGGSHLHTSEADMERARKSVEFNTNVLRVFNEQFQAGEELKKQAEEIRQIEEYKDNSLQHQLGVQRETLELERAKEEVLAGQAARMRDAATAGERLAKNQDTALQIGRNPTEQMMNEVAGIRGIADAGFSPDYSKEKEVSEAAKKANDRAQAAAQRKEFDEIYERDTGQKIQSDAERRKEILYNQRDKRLEQTGELDKPTRKFFDVGEHEDARKYEEHYRTDDPVKQQQAVAEAMQHAARLSELQLSLDHRRYELAAAIANERQKEAEAASKNFMMASREDQLRATALKKYTQENGPLDMKTFSFMSQESREAVTKFTPEGAPQEAQTELNKLQRESVLLGNNFTSLSAEIEATAEALRKMKLVTPDLPKEAGGGAIAFNVAPPQINLQFAEQFKEISKGIYDLTAGALRTEMDAMRAEMQGAMSGLMAMGQTGGASSVNSAAA